MKTLRPLGSIMKSLEEAGFLVTYAYEDLLFIEHSPFLLKFDAEDTQKLYFYSHVDCAPGKHDELFCAASHALMLSDCTVKRQGTFTLHEDSENTESISITFYDITQTE